MTAINLYRSIMTDIDALEANPMLGYSKERKAVIDKIIKKSANKTAFKKAVMSATGLTSKGFNGDIYCAAVYSSNTFKRSK